MTTKEQYFTPKNESKDKDEIISPCDKYKLIIRYYKTRQGCWGYSRGTIYNIQTDQEIGDVKRNYSSFPYEFVTHPNGHSYLICGEDYQGQTVIELDTGKRRDSLPEEAKEGWGFCWRSYKFEPINKILIVRGCYWGASDDYKFFDFSDPMSGWEEIEIPDDLGYIGDDRKEPLVLPDGTIKCYQTEYDYDNDDEDEKTTEQLVDAEIITLKRDGNKLILIDRWVSEAEKERRTISTENEKKYQEELQKFKETDPLYLRYAELVKDKALSPEDYESRGITHEGWGKGSGWSGNESRHYRRIIGGKKNDGRYTIDLEWAIKTGPIKLDIFKGRNNHSTKFFEHSVKGMEEAFQHAKSLLKPSFVSRILSKIFK